MEGTIHKAKQCLLDATPLTVQCEDTWVSKTTYTYNFINIDRDVEVRAERDFLKIYVKLYDVLISISDYHHEHQRLTIQPQPLKLNNLNYKININNEELIKEICSKIVILRKELANYPFQIYDDLTTHQNYFFNISVTNFVKNTENILELFNDVCTLKHFYREKHRYYTSFCQQQVKKN